MKHAHIAFLILVPAALATTGCQNRNQTFAAWPFRGGTSAAEFGGQATASADPFQREQNRLANEARLAERMRLNQQQRTPQQYASAEPVAGQPTNMQSAGTQSTSAQPFPTGVTQVSHAQPANGDSTTSGNPFAQSAQKGQWHSRETRTTAKVE